MRPTTVWHRDGWAWICPTCATSEAGFVMEHHARTIADEHVRAHTPDMTSSAFGHPQISPSDPQVQRAPIAQLALHSVEREPRKVTV